MKESNPLTDVIKRLTNPDNRKLIVILTSCSLLIGLLLGSIFTAPPSNNGHNHGNQHQQQLVKKKKEVWTCSMHPQIRESGPGKCPLCGMDLIPTETNNDPSAGSYTVKLSKDAIKLAEVQTTPVRYQLLEKEIRTIGKIDFDETRQAHIAAWFPGRIEHLFVDYTGVKVSKGDHMVKIYSPDILAAQEELLQAIKAARNIRKSSYAGIKKLTLDTVNDVRNKLRLWGFSNKQIAQIEKRKKTTDKMTVFSPLGGVVTKMYVQEGMYVKTGSKIYSIADLTHLWVKLDVYESDIAFIKFGQPVELFTESYPGIIFKGKISFIDPILNPKTQTIKVRVNIENKDGKLRPGMFAHAKIFSKISTTGVMMDQQLHGKYICPMHPEVMASSKIKCRICGMDLVSTNSLGYTNGPQEHTAPLVIPSTAPLMTGERAIVYISQGDGKYLGRQITLGAKVGKFYIVLEGLKEGELVVTNGNFKIDSAAQLLAKPSMMNPEGGGVAPTGHEGHSMEGDDSNHQQMPTMKKSTMKFEVSKVFKKQLDGVITSSHSLRQALAGDKFQSITGPAKELLQNLAAIDMSLLKGAAHMKWMDLEKRMNIATSSILKAEKIDNSRVKFRELSDALIETVTTFGTSGAVKTKRFFCPMAFGGGAYWLQESDTTSNPYYGAAMLTCGERK